LNIDDIKAANPIIYDSWDHDSRQVVEDLAALEQHTEDGKEIRIYDANGTKIARRAADLTLADDPCGILVNLRTIASLFQSDNDTSSDVEMDTEDEDIRPSKSTTNKVTLSVYPQAYLRDYGHIQAKGSIQLMKPVMDDINKAFQGRREDNDLSSDGPDIYNPSVAEAVSAISTQMYNESNHKAASHAGALDVQRAKLTAAVSGGSATTPKNKKTAEKLRHYCNTKLPHARFADRVNIPDCPSSLRLESVYVVDMHQMPERDRNGR
jgi:hypothetical protein